MKTGNLNYKDCLPQNCSIELSLQQRQSIFQWIREAKHWRFITKQKCREVLTALQIAHQLHVKFLYINNYKIQLDRHPIVSRRGFWEGALVLQTCIAIGLVQPITPIIDYSHPALLMSLQKYIDIHKQV
jgi:hypothetical protein